MDSQTPPTIIPPRSVFRLAHSDAQTPEWTHDIGREFRIGYYGHSDGLETIWLVNSQGEYEQTTDRQFLLDYFELIHLSDETDVYGDNRPILQPLATSQPA